MNVYGISSGARSLLTSILAIGIVTSVAFGQDETTKQDEKTSQDEKANQVEKTDQTQSDDSKQDQTTSGTGEAKNENSASNDALSQLMTQWQDISSKLIAKETEYGSAPSNDERTRIKTEFELLASEAGALVEKIEAAALKKYGDNKDDKNTLRILLGCLVNRAHMQQRVELISLFEQMQQLGIEEKYFQATLRAPQLGVHEKRNIFEILSRISEAQANDLPRVKLVTDKGEIVLELFENEAPNTVANYISLVEKGFYNGLTFHRVMEKVMAQGGCPKGNGSGDDGYKIGCECVQPDARMHFQYSLCMAHGGRNTGGTQFYITTNPVERLDFQHTVFGRVVEGFDVVQSLTITHDQMDVKMDGVTPSKIIRAEVVRKRDHEYKFRKVGDPAEQKENPPANPPIGSGGKTNDEKKDDSTSGEEKDKSSSEQANDQNK